MNENRSEEEPAQLFLSGALPALSLLASLFLLNFLSRIIFSPLLPIIKVEMGFDNTASGAIFLLLSVGYFLAILLSSFVYSMISHRNTIFLSALGSGVMVFFLGHVEGPFQLRLGLFSLGLFAGLYLPSALATIANSVAPKFLTRGMAIHELAPNIGFVVAPLFSQLMMQWFSWRISLKVLGVFMVAMSLFYFRNSRGSTIGGKRINLKAIHSLLVLPEFLMMVGLFSLAICSTLGLYAMLPLFLVTSHGMEMSQANNLLALSRISSIVMPLVGGWFGDIFGNRNVVTSVLFLAGILTIALGSTGGTALVVVAVLQAMVAVCFFPSGFALLSRISPKEGRGYAVSLCIPFAFLAGGGLMPTLIGVIGDHFSFSLGLHCMGVMMMAGGLAVFINPRRKTPSFRSGI